MKPIKQYLNEAEQRGIVKNDAEIATRLGVARSAVSRWRAGERAPDDDQAIALAQLLGVPEGEMLAECAAARTKNPVTRAAWERVAKIASMSSACLIFAIVVMLGTTPNDAHAKSIGYKERASNNTNYRVFSCQLPLECPSLVRTVTTLQRRRWLRLHHQNGDQLLSWHRRYDFPGAYVCPRSVPFHRLLIVDSSCIRCAWAARVLTCCVRAFLIPNVAIVKSPAEYRLAATDAAMLTRSSWHIGFGRRNGCPVSQPQASLKGLPDSPSTFFHADRRQPVNCCDTIAR